MTDWTVLAGDAKGLPLPNEHVEAVVCDPPYGLEFMGKAWDHGVPGVPFWEEALRVLKPGGQLLAFGGTRTHHRLMVAIEDAGFEIRDTLSWMYGTGFPKSHDISKAIDEAEGAEREVVGTKRGTKAAPETGRSDMPGKATGVKQVGTEVPITAPATEQAERWDGWGTALKPGWEPIVLAMKPLDGTFAENALEHGVAGLNIDACRLSTNENLDGGAYAEGEATGYWGRVEDRQSGEYEQPEGRWPANVVLSHTPWCRKVGTKEVKSGVSGPESKDSFKAPSVLTDGEDKGADEKGTERGYGPVEETEDWSCPPTCPVRMLDEQSGELSSHDTADNGGYRKRKDDGVTNLKSGTGGTLPPGRGDTGGASRFFYCSKASRREREAGLPDVDGRANQHPTVKPIDLCRWLVRLVTRPEHTVLDPFMGSGSIGCAAVQERRDFIGLDKSREYVELAEKRIAHWEPKHRDLFLDREAS